MISIILSGKERVIRYDINAICDLEVKANKGIAAIMSEENAGFNTLRLLLWAGLKHNNRGLTLDMVGVWIQKYIDENGDFEQLFELCAKGLEESGVLGKKKAEEVEN